MKRCAHVLATAVVAGATVLAGGGPASAVDGPGPVVQTGDIDLLEDVFEHISVPIVDGGRAVHQMYDSRATAAG
ncbi:hypothetical protein ABCR94_29930 [Streptomyces sp. 21So2-11]|uniref:hypothetical protein n=1 Tax=Streptomyces sp. 21So2-11 TaxID=3144408 RepID=UPI003218E923